MFPSIILSFPETEDEKEILLALLSDLGLPPDLQNPLLLRVNRDGRSGVEEIRRFTKKLSQKSYSSDPRVAIIHNAQTLSLEAQNTLLKIVEEPPPDTHIILLCSNDKQILETLRSRCQIINRDSSPPPKIKKTDLLFLLKNEKSLARKISWAQEEAKKIPDLAIYMERQLSLLATGPKPSPSLAQTLVRARQMSRSHLDPVSILVWVITRHHRLLPAP